MADICDARVVGLDVDTSLVQGIYNDGNIWPGVRNGEKAELIAKVGFVGVVFGDKVKRELWHNVAQQKATSKVLCASAVVFDIGAEPGVLCKEQLGLVYLPDGCCASGANIPLFEQGHGLNVPANVVVIINALSWY